MKVLFYRDELYPEYRIDSVGDQYEGYVELTDLELEDFKRVANRFYYWQSVISDRFEELK